MHSSRMCLALKYKNENVTSEAVASSEAKSRILRRTHGA